MDRHDRRRLARALKAIHEARWYRRVAAVLNLARGCPAREVAKLLGIGSRAVLRWAARYRRSHRVEDLKDAVRSGRPPTAPALSAARIVREFKKDPMALGYRATTWTVPLLAGHLSRRYHCPINRRTLRRRMKALGLVWKRPRHVYRDPEAHVAQKKGGLCGGCGS